MISFCLLFFQHDADCDGQLGQACCCSHHQAALTSNPQPRWSFAERLRGLSFAAVRCMALRLRWLAAAQRHRIIIRTVPGIDETIVRASNCTCFRRSNQTSGTIQIQFSNAGSMKKLRCRLCHNFHNSQNKISNTR
uniref:Uncharacterized protein n=1 Tax=Arundo donax TaxID=35708 RepID=A0A0A8ZW94_ARUDO